MKSVSRSSWRCHCPAHSPWKKHQPWSAWKSETAQALQIQKPLKNQKLKGLPVVSWQCPWIEKACQCPQLLSTAHRRTSSILQHPCPEQKQKVTDWPSTWSETDLEQPNKTAKKFSEFARRASDESARRTCLRRMSIWYNSSSLFADLERFGAWASSEEGPRPLPLLLLGPLPRPVFPPPFFLLEAVILIGADAPGRHGMLWKLLSPQPNHQCQDFEPDTPLARHLCFHCWEP